MCISTYKQILLLESSILTIFDATRAVENTTIVTGESLKTFIYQGDYKPAYFVEE